MFGFERDNTVPPVWAVPSMDGKEQDEQRRRRRQRLQPVVEGEVEEPFEQVEFCLAQVKLRPSLSAQALLACAESVTDLSAFYWQPKGVTVDQLEQLALGPYQELFQQVCRGVHAPSILLEDSGL